MEQPNTVRAGTTLVLGGTRKTGRRIVERLAARDLPVEAGSRSGEAPFDWGDEATWGLALQGVGSVYISYYPDLTGLGAVDAVRAFSDLAVRSGVRRLVLLSGRGEAEAQLAEQVVQDSGAQWTIVRCAWFSQNFSENYLLGPILEGEEVVDGSNAYLTDGVQRALGRPPRGFEDYPRDTAATGVWGGVR